jgi:hypothetical protein
VAGEVAETGIVAHLVQGRKFTTTLGGTDSISNTTIQEQFAKLVFFCVSF